jgi:hypoxanthine phosphoribosyltransferase
LRSSNLKFKQEVNEKTSPKEYCSWAEIGSLTKVVAGKIKKTNKEYDVILGITNGGIIPARLLALELGIKNIQLIPVRNKKLFAEEMPQLYASKKYLVVDEIYDTGDVFFKVHSVVRNFDCNYAFLMKRFKNAVGDGPVMFIGKTLNHDKWVVFPWEQKTTS